MINIKNPILRRTTLVLGVVPLLVGYPLWDGLRAAWQSYRDTFQDLNQLPEAIRAIWKGR